MSNKGSRIITSLNVKLHRLIGKWQSSIMTFGLNKGYFVTVILALVSIAKLLIDIQEKGNRIDVTGNITILGPIIATAISAGITAVTSIVKYKNLSGRYRIISDPFYKKTVIERIKLSDRQIGSGYQIKTFFNGEAHEQYCISQMVNKKIITNQSMDLIQLKERFEIVDELKNFVPSILKRSFASDRLIFNGRLVRMASDLYLDTQTINVQEARYFDAQCTNEIAYKIIKPTYSLDKMFYGEAVLYNTTSILYDLEKSSCANIIGASTLVVTQDHKIIIGKQGDFSRANAGRYAPSGSGSAGISDWVYQTNFFEMIKKAMEREFCEECNYPFAKLKETMKTRIIGYTRLIERGGKPDFFGISYINENAVDIQRNVKKLEHGLSDQVEIIPIREDGKVGESLFEFCQMHIPSKRVSIQLVIIAEILKDFEALSPIQELVCQTKIDE